MDIDEIRKIISNSRTNVWEIIDSAMTLASTDYPSDFKLRRDGIVERLYIQHQQPPDRAAVVTKTTTSLVGDDNDDVQGYSPHSVPQDEDVDVDVGDDQQPDPYGGLFDDEQTKILAIKQQLEDPHQRDEAVVELLQTLADMDLTFTGLKETDIGRHVNRLRKHPSNEVRILVKQLVRKWKDLVDEWVGSNKGASALANLTDGDSPLVYSAPRSAQNSHRRGPDFGYSPNPHNGSSGSEPEQQRPKAAVVYKKPTTSRPVPQSRPAMVAYASASVPPPNRANSVQTLDSDRLASARKRLQENYQEAQNAKKQRTIQVMDIHEIPKPRNGFIAKNKGNFQGRHHR